MNFPAVILDMDGVLVNFTEGMENDHPNTRFDWTRRDGGLGYNELEMLIDDLDAWFWESLNAYEYTREFLLECETLMGANVFLCTQPRESSESWGGKAAWVRNHYPMMIKKLFMTINMRHYLAGKKVILVDDFQSNVDMFENWGGIGILFPQPWNTPDYEERYPTARHAYREVLERLRATTKAFTSRR